MKVKARAKTANMPYSIWVQGEYITEPPIRPTDDLKRPIGHYIDTGGYLGANVYAIDVETLCEYIGISDHDKCMVCKNDILLCEMNQKISYFIIQDKEIIDIISDEILELEKLSTLDVKVIGNTIDFPDFEQGVRYFVDAKRKIPYLPTLDVLETPYPYFKLTCSKCGRAFLSCKYMARHKKCGGYLAMDFATRVHKKWE